MKFSLTETLTLLRRRLFAPEPKELPSVWAEREVYFNEQEIKGRFTLKGRNYIRQWIDDNGRIEEVREQTIVSGTGNGKTLSYIVGDMWWIRFKPGRAIVVFPAKKGAGGAESFSDTRMKEDILATPALKELVPAGSQLRYSLNKQFISIGGAHIDYVGGNSAAQVGSNRCSRVKIDETDKLPDKIKNEAGTGDLVKNRTEGVKEWQSFDTSTPTIEGGIIWPRLMRSNLHLYFLPCPLCNKNYETKNANDSSRNGSGKNHDSDSEKSSPLQTGSIKGWFVLGWSEKFVGTLPAKIVGGPLDGADIPFAFVRWAKEAKGIDGVWNYQKVEESAHFECPHCKGKIWDRKDGKPWADDKEWMDANGAWVCVRPGVPRHVGYHASSLYAPVINLESTLGGRAVDFLSAIEKGSIKDFINSKLALPDVGQQHAGGEGIAIGSAIPDEHGISRLPLMSIDRQAKYPGFWYVIRNWVVSALAPLQPPAERAAFLKSLTSKDAEICHKIGDLALLEQIQRCSHWRELCRWMVREGMVGDSLRKFFKEEVQGDLVRLLDFVAGKLNMRLIHQGDSEAIEIGSADSWEELDDAQLRNKVANVDVICDARFGSIDNAEVFAECYRRCPKEGFCFYSPVQTMAGPGARFHNAPFPGARPFALHGWTPCMGFPEAKTWASKDKIRLPYGQTINDPFSGKMEARQVFQYVFQFDANWALSELARVRKKYLWSLHPDVKFVGNNAQMNPVDLKEYNLHMKGYYWNDHELRWDSPAKGGGSQSRRHPNHLYDCEKNMVARAVWKGIFKYEREK